MVGFYTLQTLEPLITGKFYFQDIKDVAHFFPSTQLFISIFKYSHLNSLVFSYGILRAMFWIESLKYMNFLKIIEWMKIHF